MRTINKQTMDIEMVLGDNGTFTITPKANEISILIDGDYIEFIATKQDSGRQLFSKTLNNFDDGVVEIPILPADTENAEAGTYIYALKLKNTNDSTRVYTLFPNTKAYAYLTLKGVS